MSNAHKSEGNSDTADSVKSFVLDYSGPGERLDRWLSNQLPDLSRSRIQALIKAGRITLHGEPCKPRHTLREKDQIKIVIPTPEPIDIKPENIPIDILYEDDDILVVNKPAGLVVHPAPGHASGTLVNALLHHCGNSETGETSLAGIGGELRPGIVHRLDKDTSGALVTAKNEPALTGLAEQFKHHTVKKEYLALVWGKPVPAEGTIKTEIGRSAHNRKKMSAKPRTGRHAITHYSTIESFSEATLLRVRIETGRTHQIRVHLAHIGHPVVGDQQYGRARKMRKPIPIKRQMLHAEHLTIEHPRTGKQLKFEAPIPEDMRAVLEVLSS